MYLPIDRDEVNVFDEYDYKASQVYNERIWLGWTPEQAIYYMTGLSYEFVMNWTPINMVWSHWLVEVKQYVK